MMRAISILAALMIVGGAVEAQIALPSARLPALPGAGGPGGGILGSGTRGSGVGLPGGLVPDVSGTASGLVRDAGVDVRRLEAARQRALAALIRRYPRLIGRDPHGAAIVRSEVVAIAPTDAALGRARAVGFEIARERALGALGVRIVVLRAPGGVSTEQALAALRGLDPAGTYDFNHLYSDSGGAARAAADDPADAGGASSEASAERRAARDSDLRGSASGEAGAAAKIGLIDSGVDGDHPAFRDLRLHRHGCAGAVVPADHGTEVASLLVGRAARFRGAAPGAELFAADVYCGQPTGGAVDAIADALDWLVRERVPVINMSLVGPPNALLARVVRSVIARGSVLVAAVGNDGPAAPPLYPAAYPGVVGVTGVDAHRRVLVEAERGAQVKFAAPGADMEAARPPHDFAVVRGTSFAAPIVAGLLARDLASPDPAGAARAIADLERRAVDLGAPGVDPVYGYGLVGEGMRAGSAFPEAR